jgi:hypothetical protein
MVALVILMMVVLMFGRGLISAAWTNRFASNHYRATCLARNRLQRAMSLDLDSIELMDETMVEIDWDGNVDLQGTFRRTTIVSNITDDCVEITVRVHYPMPKTGGVTDAPIVMSTMIARQMVE